MTTFKIYKEEVSKTEPEVYLDIIRERGITKIVAVDPETGQRFYSGCIASFEADGTLSLHAHCVVPGIKTDDAGRIVTN